ncbi:MAG: hypothetical protein ACPGOV_00570 [Magnetovibrionaceae bacterium]
MVEQKGLPNQENLLLDYMRRLEQHKDDRSAVHIHLSRLRPFNRREQHVRAAANNFEGFVKNMTGQMFIIHNADLVFIFKTEVKAEVQGVVQRVRFLFSDDPMMENPEAPTLFATWYDVSNQFDELLHVVQGLVDVEAKKQADGGSRGGARMGTRAALRAKQERGEPLTPEILGKVEEALQRADLSNLVRRQFICSVDQKMVPEEIFSELFISIADLRETIIPGVNLTANRWLFQHLTEVLDKRMLSMLMKTDRISITGDISFNLNVSTLLSPAFLSFDDNVSASRRGSMVIELQMVDVFADLGAYAFAREFVQDKGYRICLDGLTYDTMTMLDRERLGADLIKLVWHPELVDRGEDFHEKLRAVIKRTGDDRIVLCRVDNREAVDFGRSVGIHIFQGRHVEKLIADDSRRREMMKLKRRIERS